MNLRKSKWLMLPAALAVSSSLLAADAYDVVDLGKLDGNQSIAMDINESGQVVGRARVILRDENGDPVASGTMKDRAALFDSGSIQQLNDITDLESNNSMAFSINDNGLAVGEVNSVPYEYQEPGCEPTEEEPNKCLVTGTYNAAAVFSTTGGSYLLPLLDSLAYLDMGALAINNNGLVAGWAMYNPPNDVDDNGNSIEISYSRGIIYDSALQTITRIDPLVSESENGQSVSLRGINDAGRAVGWSTKTLDEKQTISGIWLDASSPETVNEILIGGGNSTFPYAINDNNQVVGMANSQNEPLLFTAFILDLNTNESTDIGLLDENLKPAFPSLSVPGSVAYDINNQGVAVGRVFADGLRKAYHAFVYENGQLADLNDRIDCSSGWELTTAQSINEAGEIVGTGTFEDEVRAFKLVPRANGQREACAPEETNEGGGSVGYFLLGLLPAILRRRFKTS